MSRYIAALTAVSCCLGLVYINVGNCSASLGRIAFAFHARDANLVVGPGTAAGGIPFRVYLDGRPVGDAHGTDVGADGTGIVDGPGTYQLVRQGGPIDDHVVELEFQEPGLEAYCFTFG